MSTRSLSLVLPDIWQLGCGWCEPGPHEECWSNAAWPFLRPYSHGDGCRGKACCASLHERMLLSLSVRFICQSIPNAFGWIFQVFPSSDEIEKKRGKGVPPVHLYTINTQLFLCWHLFYTVCLVPHTQHSQSVISLQLLCSKVVLSWLPWGQIKLRAQGKGADIRHPFPVTLTGTCSHHAAHS